VNTAVGYLGDIERLAETLPEKDPLRQASSFRAVINSYTTRFSNVVSAQKLIGFNENDGLQGKLRTPFTRRRPAQNTISRDWRFSC